MKVLSLGASTPIGIVSLLLLVNAANSADVSVLAASGIQAVVEDLGPKFERETGHKLSMTFATGGATVKRAQGGGVADVVIAPKPGIDSLVKGGKVAADNVTTIATTGISVAIRKGAPKPNISSPDSFKRTVLAAKSITYLNPADGAASGIHFAKVIDQLGIANEMKSKTIFAPKIDALGAMVANGEAEIGVLQYQLLFIVPGIEVIGPLPGALQDSTIFSAAVMNDAKETEASKALINFMHTPQAQAAIKAKGMEPAQP